MIKNSQPIRMISKNQILFLIIPNSLLYDNVELGIIQVLILTAEQQLSI